MNLYGVNLGTATRIDGSFSEGGPLPYALAGTEVRFNGIPAPLVSVADQQVVAEVPFGIAGSRTVEIELVHNGESSNIATVPGAAVEPQVLQSGPDSSGQRYAAALNQDGTVNGPHNPATAGSVVAIYLNGAGVLSPLPQDGAPGTADQTLPAPVSIVVGVGIAAAVPAQVLYAGAAPGLAGLMQLNFQVPSPYSRLVFGGGSASRFWVEIGGVSTTYSHFWVAPP